MNSYKYNDIIKRAEFYALKYIDNSLILEDTHSIAAEAYRKGACDEYEMFDKAIYNIPVENLLSVFRILPTDLVEFQDNNMFLFRIVENPEPLSVMIDRPMVPGRRPKETEILFEYNFLQKQWFIKSIK